ncbi:MAG: PCMD domain-containing protein [Bacteroidales bacterium]|nr:PCMD domain-containing protein [Bacteroidales bacterium]MCF8457347.1 PCMD domain-containing protein [Bacteroidales bacterium]
MKKKSTFLKLFLIISIPILSGHLYAQTLIPNSGFEDWDTGISYDNPTYWESPNAIIASLGVSNFIAFEDNDSLYSGDASVRLESKNITIFTTTVSVPGIVTLGDISVNLITTEVSIDGGTPFTGTPDKLVGHYNYSPSGSDNCYIEIVLLDYNTITGTTIDTIGAGMFIGSSSTAGWESFEVPITYFDTAAPNYMNITILGSNPNNIQIGSKLWIDDLSLETTSPVDHQYVSLPQGWSFFSSYIDPFESNIDSLCTPFVTEVIIAKDGDGQTYWPLYGLNALGDILIGDGYQIKMATAQTMDVAGLAVVPENTPVTIDQGWSFLGYLRQSPAPINVMLSTVVSQVIIAKDENGLTYWPQYGINVIGNMVPGEGYQIKMSSQQSIVYPAN